MSFCCCCCMCLSVSVHVCLLFTLISFCVLCLLLLWWWWWWWWWWLCCCWMEQSVIDRPLWFIRQCIHLLFVFHMGPMCRFFHFPGCIQNIYIFFCYCFSLSEHFCGTLQTKLQMLECCCFLRGNPSCPTYGTIVSCLAVLLMNGRSYVWILW